MKIVLYDIGLTGHKGSYLSAISKEAVRKGWHVSIVLPKRVEAHFQMEVLRKNVGSENIFLTDHWVETPPKFSRLSLFRHHIAQREVAVQSLRPFIGRCDFIYTTNIDYMNNAVQLFGAPSYPTPFGGTVMRARFHMKAIGVSGAKSTAAGLIEGFNFRRLLSAKGVSCVTTADPGLADFCHSQRERTFKKVKYVPEIGMLRPSIGRDEARARFGFRPNDRVILVYGLISKRKGIDELLQAVRRLERDSPIKVLVAGQPDEEMRLVLQSKFDDLKSERLRLLLGFVDYDLENTVFAAADAVWVAYKNHSTMSGVFYQAVCCGLPVIAPNYGILHWLAGKHGTGITVDPDAAEETGRQLTKLLCDGEEYAEISQKARDLASFHSPESFGRAVCDAIFCSCS
jgi:glycosyltransferase involved in cell wall biosynthesis